MSDMRYPAMLLVAMTLLAGSCAGPHRPVAAPPPPAGAEMDRAAPRRLDGEVVIDLGKGGLLRLVLIQPGRFVMGGSADTVEHEADELPAHEVTISRPFYMGAFEVTQAQYQAVMGGNPSLFAGADRPVERVVWHEAAAFCRELGRRIKHPVRLPTEAEWEYACRAGANTRFSFGSDESALPLHANFCDRHTTGPAPHRQDQYDDGHDKTAPVGSYRPNAWGLYDMHGNVFEWCQDWYRDTYYARSPAVDPPGAEHGPYRVLRGGSWNSPPWHCRSAYRHRFTADGRFNHLIGFRIVIPVADESHGQP